MKKELFIAGYDFGQWRVKKTTRLGIVYGEALAICKDVPYEMMITIRWRERETKDYSMPVWVDGFSGVIASAQYLGRMYRLYAKNYSNVQIISGAELYVAQKVTIILLGDGYGKETP